MQDLVKSEHIMQSSHPREFQSYHKNEMKTIQVVEQILMLYCMTNQNTYRYLNRNSSKVLFGISYYVMLVCYPIKRTG